jgi:hypothetical protein
MCVRLVLLPLREAEMPISDGWLDALAPDMVRACHEVDDDD